MNMVFFGNLAFNGKENIAICAMQRDGIYVKEM